MRKLLTLALAVSLLACDDSTIQMKSFDGSDPESLPINSKIIIEPREILKAEGRQINLYCETEKEYSCFCLPLLNEQEFGENSFKVTFTSVGQPTICLTAFGPAIANINLNSLSNGQYAIELNNGAFKNKGTLKITDDNITLDIPIKFGIAVKRAVTRRVPDKTYWVTFYSYTTSSANVVEQFIEKLKNLGATFSSQEPGDYYYYEIDDTGEIVPPPAISTQGSMRIIFQFNGDESKLKDLIQVEGKSYRPDVYIQLSSYKGEQIYN